VNVERTIEQQAPTWRRWRACVRHEPTLTGLTYEQVRAELRHGTQDRQDELLAALVRLAQQDADAAPVVVACLLPGLRGLIARHAPGLDRPEAMATALRGLWESVVRFDGHPVFVASRLLRLPKQRLQQAVRSEDAWRHRHTPLSNTPGPTGQLHLPAASCLRLAVDAGVLTAADAWLIHATRVVGHSLGWAAKRLAIGYEAAKKRRQRAEARWAAWWAPQAPRSPVVSFSTHQPEEVA
jgi:hypothetical protein